MPLLEQIKSFPVFLPALRTAFKERWILLVFLVLFVVPFSILKTLEEDGSEVFASQKDALMLEVFARTDLKPEAYPALEQVLKSLSGVKEVIAVSPEESLKKVANDPKLGIDPGWLGKKSQDLKNKDTILPWSYNVHLARWNDADLKTLVQKIEGLEMGKEKIKAVAEIHYDKERWSLAFALRNYVRWLKRSLAFLLLITFASAIFLAVRVRGKISSDPEFLTAGWGFLALGLAGGILSHVIQLVILSVSFFPESFSWKDQIGQGLLFQAGLSVILSLSGFGVWLLGKTA